MVNFVKVNCPSNSWFQCSAGKHKIYFVSFQWMITFKLDPCLLWNFPSQIMLLQCYGFQPLLLNTGFTYFLPDVLSERQTTCCGESLTMLQVLFTLEKKSYPLHLLKTDAPQKFFLKHCHAFLKSSRAMYGCHFKEICTNVYCSKGFAVISYAHIYGPEAILSII